MRQTIRVFIPQDAAAIAVGAEPVAQAIQAQAADQGFSVQVIRHGSRGLHWLEPLVEVETSAGRVGYGPVCIADVPDLFKADFLFGRPHALYMGVVDQIPFLKNQTRLVFRRVGLTEPLGLQDYEEWGGWKGLLNALKWPRDELLECVAASGLRGRGGAGFPTGRKWATVANAHATQKYVVCNADEGDSGTFSDRMLMEGDPYSLIEGMTIAAIATGASQGFVYIRSEYPLAIQSMQKAIDSAREQGWIGDSIAGSTHRFDIQIRKAAGSYVCGEETAMLESIEGKRGVVRSKPPLPALQGLFGSPTVINNVMTFASIPWIVEVGSIAYKSIGTSGSPGTLPFQLSGNVRYSGLVEVPFGVTLRQLLVDFGGGTRSGRPIKAVQVGGPLGAYIPEQKWDQPIDYETYSAFGAVVGHGGIVVHDDTADMAALAEYAMAFCAFESCGKCTPCRIGAVRGQEVIQRIRKKIRPAENIELLLSLCNTMSNGSLCAMGSMTPYPVLSALEHYPQDFHRTN